MRTLKKHIDLNSSGTWQFLRSYRATPHSSTGESHTTALFGHNIRTHLPTISTNIKVNVWTKMKESDEKYKHYQKIYADKKRHTMKNSIKCGDPVRVKNQTRNKVNTPLPPRASCGNPAFNTNFVMCKIIVYIISKLERGIMSQVMII